jgi:hypothetical protein
MALRPRLGERLIADAVVGNDLGRASDSYR